MTLRPLCPLFLLATLLIPLSASPALASSTADPYKQALQAIEANDWIKARGLLGPLADQGNAGAQFSLGLMYQLGRGVKQDHKKAMAYYLKAAAQGFAPAENNIGMMYKLGLGVQINYKTAAEWFKRATKNHTMAKYNLADLYENGLGITRDYKKAAALYIECAQEGSPQCEYFAARCYDVGRGVKQDKARAKTLYYRSAAKHFTLAVRKVRMLKAAEARKRQEAEDHK